MLSQPEKSLRLKVWVTICITLIIVTGAVLWSYKSFQELTNSIDKLGQPDQKLTLINNILRDFISAENNVQRYIITGDVKSARTYEKQVDETRLKIRELKILVKEDSSQLDRVDSLELVFQKKLDYLNRFLTLKKKRQVTTFTQLALDQIEASTGDSAMDVNQSEEQRLMSDQFWSSLKKLYGRKGIPYDTANWSGEDYLAYLADPESITDETQSLRDTLLSRVKAILAQTGDMELQMQQRLTQREYALLLQGKAFMDEIQSIISALEAKEQAIVATRKEEASVIVTNSTRIIGLIGLVGLLVAMLLLVLISRDIIKVSYFRRKLEESRHKAEQFGKMKESFLANMSHEIRTPLNSILGFTSLMSQTRLTDEQQKYMKAVNGSSDYLMELVTDILDHSKNESGKLELVKQGFETRSLADDALAMFLLMAESKGLDLMVKVNDAVPRYLKGDVFRIRQIINNLLSNAIKFTEKGTVALFIDGSWFKEVFYLELSVADTGIGIETGRLELIFESFQQENASIPDDFGGTGLGLSICKQLSEAMGGNIQASSQKGVGTTFTLKLPLERAAPESSQQEDTDRQNARFYEANVVLVDDDDWNALLLETLLKKKVRQVKVFTKPEEAAHHIASHKNEIDLLFTDMKMPEMTGEELSKTCREAGYNGPIVLVTAYVPQDKEDQLEDLEIQAVCNKPYQEVQIDQLLERFLVPLDGHLTREVSDTPANDYTIDISDLKLFADGDPNALEELLTELIINNEKQVLAFQELQHVKEWLALADLAHKMLPTYDHTGVRHISELLRSLELCVESGNYSRTKELATETMPLLNDCLIRFKKLKAQYHIA